jgi:SAM-dependent methyltransferase
VSASRFDRTADSYAEAARRRNWDNLVAWCEPQPGDQVLDVAGGTGALADALAGRVAEVTVSDISEPMLAYVNAPAKAVPARAEQLPFADDSFDLVACVRALHHVDSPTRALDEMARVVRPGGRIVIEDFLADPDPDRARRWEEIERLRDPGHRRLVAAGEVRSRLLAKGLSVDAEEQWVEDRTVASWLGLAACEGEAAKRVRELVGGPEFQIRVGRARFRRPPEISDS